MADSFIQKYLALALLVVGATIAFAGGSGPG